jgi:hypothetical protein
MVGVADRETSHIHHKDTHFHSNMSRTQDSVRMKLDQENHNKLSKLTREPPPACRPAKVVPPAITKGLPPPEEIEDDV